MNKPNQETEERISSQTNTSDNVDVTIQDSEKDKSKKDSEPDTNYSSRHASLTKLKNTLPYLAKIDMLLWYTTIITLAFLSYISYNYIVHLEYIKKLNIESFNYSFILMTLFGLVIFLGALLIPYSKIKRYIEEVEKISTEKHTYKLYTIIATMVLLLITTGISIFAMLYETLSHSVHITINSELLTAFYIFAIAIFLFSLIYTSLKFIIKKDNENKFSKRNGNHVASILTITAFVIIPLGVYMKLYKMDGTLVSVSPMSIMGLSILIVSSIFLSDLTIRNFIKYLKENGDKDKKRIYVLWYFVIAILIGLLAISVLSVIRSDHSVTLSSESAASILLTGLGIFIAGSIFFPQFTMERLVNDKIDSVRRRVGAEMTEKVDKSEETLKGLEHELLKLEAHECRMNAFFLYKQKEYGWSIGWILKAIYKYEVLLEKHPMDDRYDTLVRDLIWLSKEVFYIIANNIKEDASETKTEHYENIRASYLFLPTANNNDIDIDIDTISRKEEKERALSRIEEVKEKKEFRVSIRQYDIRTRYVRYFKIILKYIDLELYKYQIRGALRQSFEDGKSIFRNFILEKEIIYVFDNFRKESSKSDIQQIIEDFKKYPKCQESITKYFEFGFATKGGFENMEDFLNKLIKQAEDYTV